MRLVRRGDTGTREEGFTLIETLAAFTILVMVLAALFTAMGGGIRASARAAFAHTAARLAQSSLAELGRSQPLLQGVTEGRYGTGYQWQIEVTPYPGGAIDGGPALYWVRITVRAGPLPGADSFTMAALKTAPVPP